MFLSEWKIKEHDEYKKTIKHIPKQMQEYIRDVLRPTMEEYPFTNAIPLKNKLEGFYEQKIENYRLIFKVNIRTHTVYFLWIRAKPHVTARNWIQE